jgi:hypothetical protein
MRWLQQTGIASLLLKREILREPDAEVLKVPANAVANPVLLDQEL